MKEIMFWAGVVVIGVLVVGSVYWLTGSVGCSGTVGP